jgi:hypothetical protein
MGNLTNAELSGLGMKFKTSEWKGVVQKRGNSGTNLPEFPLVLEMVTLVKFPLEY